MSVDDDFTRQLRAIAVFAGDLPRFDAAAAPDEPVALFREWMSHAINSGIREPHAMTLATVDDAGRPNVRVLILKGVSCTGGWRFAGSSGTTKGAEIAATGVAAATFYWPDHGRQIRLRGPVRSAGPQASAEDFLARGASARAETLVARQGQHLEDPQDLEIALSAARQRVIADPALVAPQWTLWEIAADEIEFAQGNPDRRHTRVAYSRTDTGWTRQRLWP